MSGNYVNEKATWQRGAMSAYDRKYKSPPKPVAFRSKEPVPVTDTNHWYYLGVNFLHGT